METRADTAPALVLERASAAPGEPVRGRVSAERPVWAVDLVRVEASPSATLEFTAASVTPLSSTVGSEAWNSRDLKSRPH